MSCGPRGKWDGPIFFATTIIVVAFLPLFTMTGVPGKVFAPMSLTYGFALSGRC